MGDDTLYCSTSNLLCTETSLCFNNFMSLPTDDQTFFVQQIFVSPLTEEYFYSMIEREKQHLPRDGYLQRLRSGDLNLEIRRLAVDWICKAHTHYSFGPLSLWLSVNCLDRFLSVYELPRDKTWTIQLLAVSCLSLAAKMEESTLPLSVDLQVGEPKFVFEGRTIERMEILVLRTLQWRIHACSPFSFIDYFLGKTNVDHEAPIVSLISRSSQLILSTIKGIDFLEFKPSEVAAAVALFALGEKQEVDIDKAMPCFILVEKERVVKCLQLVQDLNSSSGASSINPQSPVGVLDGATCLSYKCDELGVGSCSNSPNSSLDTKTRKLDTIPQEKVFK